MPRCTTCGGQLDPMADALDAITALCGGKGWEYPGQAVRDVQLLVARTDRLRDALVEIARLAVDTEHSEDQLRAVEYAARVALSKDQLSE